MRSDPADDVRAEVIAQLGIVNRPFDPELAAIVAFTAAKNASTFAAISIITGHRQIIMAAFGTDIVETSRANSFCATTIQRPGEPLIVHDALADPRFADLAVVTGAPYVRFYAGVPVMDRNGYPLGALCIGDSKPRSTPFDPTDLMARGREVERLLRW